MLAFHFGGELLSLPDTGERRGAFIHREIYGLLLGRKGEGRVPFLCLLFLNCLQLKIILCQIGIFGVVYSGALHHEGS